MSDEYDWFLDLSGESAVPLPTLDPVTPRQTLRSGLRIADRFELLEQLGSGAMGVVYHAHEVASGRSVAIKFMTGTLNPTQKERFRREGVVTAAIRHPGIVSIHGAGAIDGAPYLVYEYVAGGRTLRDLLNARAPRKDLLAALRDAAQALGAAHAQGVVHRDVKPGNLLVTPDGQVRVADFGLVRTADMEALTKTGNMLGTPRYMPYEQFIGDRGKIGPAADVWALGVILHEVITGEFPFAHSSMIELISAIQDTPIDPRRSTPALEPELEAICKRALQRESGQRYPDGAALAADLSRFLAGERPIADVRSRRPAAIALVFTVLVVLCAILALSRQDETLTQALSDYDAGRANAQALEAALVANPDAPPLVRASAHSELAEGDGGGRERWERRLAHAERALTLDPERPAARGRQARALLELGRYEEAVSAFDEARRSGGEAAQPLYDAELLVGCSRWEDARRVLQAYRSASNSLNRVATRLELEVAIGLGEGGAALSQRRGEISASSAAILEAKLAQASGDDALGPLRRWVKTRPKDADASQALVRIHLERAELAEAMLALNSITGARTQTPPNLKQALQALRQRDVQPARLLPRSWKLSVGRCLTLLARRELDLARQARDPRYEVGPGALSSQERAKRAERYLAFTRAELHGEDLGRDLAERRGSAQALLMRAQAARDLRDHARSLATLEEYVESRDYDLGSYDEFIDLTKELETALPEARERLRVLTLVPPPLELKRNDDTPPRSPYDWDAVYRLAAANLRADPGPSLRACVLATSRAPRLLGTLRDDLFLFSRSSAAIGNEQALAALSNRLKGPAWIDRLARATLEALVVEFERGTPTTVELDRLLEDYPGIVFARVLRAMVNTRAGRNLAAREDLAIVREICPEDRRVTAFVYALLLAKEGAPVPEVLAALEAAKAKGFRVGDGWLDDDYPELAPYLDDPEIRWILTQKRKRRQIERDR